MLTSDMTNSPSTSTVPNSPDDSSNDYTQSPIRSTKRYSGRAFRDRKNNTHWCSECNTNATHGSEPENCWTRYPDQATASTDSVQQENTPSFSQLTATSEPEVPSSLPQLPTSSGIGSFTSSQLAGPSSSQPDFDIARERVAAGRASVLNEGFSSSQSSSNELPSVSEAHDLACVASVPAEELEPAGPQLSQTAHQPGSQDSVPSSPTALPTAAEMMSGPGREPGCGN